MLTTLKRRAIIVIATISSEKERWSTLRSWLKNKRKEKGITQATMAKKIGISRQYYAFIENGFRLPDLSLSIASKIANILDMTLEEIEAYEKRA